MHRINSEQIHTTLLDTLRQVVPQVDPQTLQPDRALHDQLHLDSIDFLRLMLTLEQEFHWTIFEFDDPQLSTLNGCEHYLTDQLALAA